MCSRISSLQKLVQQLAYTWPVHLPGTKRYSEDDPPEPIMYTTYHLENDRKCGGIFEPPPVLETQNQRELQTSGCDEGLGRVTLSKSLIATHLHRRHTHN